MVWKTTTLGEVCLKITDGSHWSPEGVNQGIPMASVKDMTDYGFNISKCRFISLEDYRQLVKNDCKPLRDDVLIAKDGSYLKHVFVWKQCIDLVILSSIAILRPNKTIIDPGFLSLYLASPTTKSEMAGYVSGVALPRIILKDFIKFKLRIPPLFIQRKIAAILSAYDNLIENNLRRIKILEEMTQNLYREWFVKFRFPACAEASAGRPGHQHARFIDSSLGRIPEEWEVVPLGSLIAEHIGGGWGNDVKDDKYTEPAWVIRGTDIPNARSCDFSKVPFRYHTKSNLKCRRLIPGDIVFEVSGGSKGQPLGRSLYVSSELLSAFNGDSVICASFCKRIRPDSEQYASELLYLSFLNAYISGEIEQYQVQSTGISNYKWSDYLEKVNRCVPPIALQERFCELSVPLFSEIATLGRKNTGLRRTRDLLLPRLISGEVDVSELDIAVPVGATL